MIKGIQALLFLPILLFAFQVKAEVQYVYPATDADIPALVDTVQLMSFLENVYKPEVQKRNLSFKWNFDWNQNYLGAGSNLYNNEFSIMLYGGFVRTPDSSFHVTALTLCHEFGHLLAGAPYQRLHNKDADDWSSAEGQSDWFAGQKCLPLVYEKFKAKIATLEVTADVEKFCSTSENKGLCQFITMAGYKFSFMNFKYFNTNLADIEKQQPHVLKNATDIPEQTLTSVYPSMQCRLDTYKNAAVCVASVATCERPRCWFNPN